jgi:hypothetical protein
LSGSDRIAVVRAKGPDQTQVHRIAGDYFTVTEDTRFRPHNFRAILVLSVPPGDFFYNSASRRGGTGMWRNRIPSDWSFSTAFEARLRSQSSGFTSSEATELAISSPSSAPRCVFSGTVQRPSHSSSYSVVSFSRSSISGPAQAPSRSCVSTPPACCACVRHSPRSCWCPSGAMPIWIDPSSPPPRFPPGSPDSGTPLGS